MPIAAIAALNRAAIDLRRNTPMSSARRSTGTPKGVAVAHACIPNLVAAQNERFAITSDARILQFASPSFDAAISEFATALASGAAIVVPGTERSGDALAELIRSQRVTHATLPPALLADLPEDLPLRTLVVAGEACSSDTVARWSQGRRMINAYGPTETTVCATMSEPLSGRAARRSAGRSATHRLMCWTIVCSRCRLELRASSTSRAPGWRAAISGVPG
jgi:non-ribosomal peptide synthetase component F